MQNSIIFVLLFTICCLAPSASGRVSPAEANRAKVPATDGDHRRLVAAQQRALAQLKPAEAAKLRALARANAAKLSTEQQEKALRELGAKMGAKAKVGAKTIWLKQRKNVFGTLNNLLGLWNFQKMNKTREIFKTRD